jgi:peptidoglycan/xylan/chitin deacetylase (PgdA/CDA1 family)
MAKLLPILTFHDIDEQPSVIAISPSVFRAGLGMLHENGYRTLRLIEAVDFLLRGAPFPDLSFVITFDDGYQSVYEKAFPVLQRFNMTATVFLAVGERDKLNSAVEVPSFEGRAMLNWREIWEMQRSGIDFGAHTLTHPDLTRLPLDRVESEVYNGKRIIEEALGTPVLCFAYPYGYYNQHVRRIVRQHFSCACSDHLGLMSHDSDPYALERVDAYYLRSNQLFSIMPSNLFPCYIWARSVPRWIRRAIKFK